MPAGHVFIATSLDGFIARADGSIDWLTARDTSGEDHGYTRFIAGIDGIIMGRGTFETVQGFDPWPYDKPVLVLSSRLAQSPVPDQLAGKVSFANLSPFNAMGWMAKRGHQRLYIDGGQIIQAFLMAGLIHDMVITRIPVLLGQGLPLFGPLAADVDLIHQDTQAFPSGLVQSRYRVA